ncbi:hypothetical protein H6F94_13825 [Leptolyngbya sp. FACHB-261]|nr:hypothetical protein [Leptolyngbya sp. FACHB-261]
MIIEPCSTISAKQFADLECRGQFTVICNHCKAIQIGN